MTAEGPKTALQVKKKAITKKGKKHHALSTPQMNEQQKTAVICSSQTAKKAVSTLLEDLHKMRKPLSVFYPRWKPSSKFKSDDKSGQKDKDTSNESEKEKPAQLLPFENIEPLENLCKKADSSNLFAFGDSTKRHPSRITFGRLFNFQLFDMFEFEITKNISMDEFLKNSKGTGQKIAYPRVGSKPILIIQGAAFESSPVLQQLKNFFADFFICVDSKSICLEGIDRVISISALDGDPVRIIIQHFSVSLYDKNGINEYRGGGSSPPKIGMTEIGPYVEMNLLRNTLPPPQTLERAHKEPKMRLASKLDENEQKKTKPKNKNIKTDALGRTVGRIHVGKTNYKELHTPHFHKK